ncbi:YjeF N-terminal domain-containing protein [Endogone sp. FLAS-F59071]|nr:YjeF N-terminal domain-containing protein [Endogone sp. FLAS-F59071]|eukprot:RUS23343.1 YjeF N-terminal domain-containing protein [Endogone sp. FLAS-F59071]
MSLRYLSQKITQAIDDELMSPAGGFSIDQLMELGESVTTSMKAGLSVAQAIARVYDREKHSRVLVCCGPGNNGGDGLVAARHLVYFGYRPNIFYPKQTSKELYQVSYYKITPPSLPYFILFIFIYFLPSITCHLLFSGPGINKRLVTQCRNLYIPFTDDLKVQLKETDLIVDAIFGEMQRFYHLLFIYLYRAQSNIGCSPIGFSFKGDIRDPFGDVIQTLKEVQIPIASVDIPSAWDVEEGLCSFITIFTHEIHLYFLIKFNFSLPSCLRLPLHILPGNMNGHGFNPDTLISLTAPKLCARYFCGRHHILGGRFVPPDLDKKYKLNIPIYQGTDQIVELEVGIESDSARL